MHARVNDCDFAKGTNQATQPLNFPSHLPRCRDLLVADANDILQDAWHLSKSRRCAGQILHETEAQRLSSYCQRFALSPEPKCNFRDLVVHLGDQPDTGWVTWSAKSHALPTIRRCGGLYAAPAHGRCLTLREMFLSMGYPTFELCHSFTNLPQNCAFRVFAPHLSWGDMRKALGNSMHVAQVGTFVGAMLLCSRKKEHAPTYGEILALMDSTVNPDSVSNKKRRVAS